MQKFTAMKIRIVLRLAVVATELTLAFSAIAQPAIFARTNLVAWCIVPFDAKKRGPEERAQMLDRLGIRRLAYDWRAEHIPTFDAEVDACKRHGIELTAWWFPTSLDTEAKTILAVLDRHKVRTQLWIMGGGEPVKSALEQPQRVQAEAARIRPIAEAAARIGCTVGLYNHGGWFGEPENQIEIIRALGITNVGIVYNFHHGHDHIARFPELFRKMQPHLLAVNLSGMIKDGEKRGQKILHLSEGDQEMAMLKVIRDSGWRGPIGIIDHRPETDSEETLRNNLRGLDWLLRELDQPGSGGPRPFKLVTAGVSLEQKTNQAVLALPRQHLSIAPGAFSPSEKIGRPPNPAPLLLRGGEGGGRADAPTVGFTGPGQTHCIPAL
jgi:sugar phosphate isomerase/epimerase